MYNINKFKKQHETSWNIMTYHGGHSGDSLLMNVTSNSASMPWPSEVHTNSRKTKPVSWGPMGSHGVPWGSMGFHGAVPWLFGWSCCWPPNCYMAIIGINSWLLWWYATSIHMLFTMVFTMLFTMVFTMVNTMVHRSAYMPFHVHCRLIWWDPRGVQLGRRRQHFERTKEDPNAEDPAMISTCTVRVPLFRSCECDCDILWPCQAMSNYVKSCQFMSNCHTVSLISIEIWISVRNLDEKCASSQAVFPESVSLSLSGFLGICLKLISFWTCWYLLKSADICWSLSGVQKEVLIFKAQGPAAALQRPTWQDFSEASWRVSWVYLLRAILLWPLILTINIHHRFIFTNEYQWWLMVSHHSFSISFH